VLGIGAELTMAGDWIKMGTGLRRHPRTVRIASALNADRLRVVGALHAVWCVFDEHSADGQLVGYTLQVMDEEIGWQGFSAAMVAVGWLELADGGLQVPAYEEHNGPTAKRRALDTKRKAESRAESGRAPKSVRDASASDADGTATREEERREEPSSLRSEGQARKRAASRPQGVDEQVWQDFLAVRAAKRAPLTDTALEGIAREAEKAGIALADAIAYCCEQGWQGFNAGWYAERRAKKVGTGETDWQCRQRERMQQLAPGVAARVPGRLGPILDLEVLRGPAVASH
jgi:hypothetical protein